MKKHLLFQYVRIFLLAGAVIFLYIFWIWHDASKVSPSQRTHGAVYPQPLGLPAPELEIPASSMSTRQGLRLQSLRGYPILIHFWATWCAPCQEELPELLRLVRRIRAQGFTVITVAEDRDWPTLTGFFREHPELAPLQQLTILALDPRGEIARTFGSSRFPETFLINDELVMDNKFVGPQPWNDAAVEPYLRRLRNAGKAEGFR